MSVVAALAAAPGALPGQSQDRNRPLSWARSEGLEPPTSQIRRQVLRIRHLPTLVVAC